MDITQKQVYLNRDSLVELDLFQTNKIVCYYFSAHWCPPCRKFTPVLSKVYNEFKEKKYEIEIVFGTSDRSKQEFEEYYSTMPFLAFPFQDPRIQQLKQKYKVSGIPTLVVLRQNGETINLDADSDIYEYGVQAYENWIKQ